MTPRDLRRMEAELELALVDAKAAPQRVGVVNGLPGERRVEVVFGGPGAEDRALAAVTDMRAAMAEQVGLVGRVRLWADEVAGGWRATVVF